MTRRSGWGLVAVGLAVGLAGCSADEGGEPLCVPGQSIGCACPSGQRGAQECRPDGQGYRPCVCGERDVAPGDLPGDLRDAPAEPAGDAEPGDAPVEEVVEETGPADVVETLPDEGVDPGPDPDTAGGGDDGATAPLALGADCDRGGACASDICLGLTVASAFHSVCAEPCCHEEECPSGFGCLQAGGGRYCLPARIFPAGTTFATPTGASCAGGGSTTCKSGICDASADLCRGTCCTDADCNVAPCHWSQAGSTLRTFCDPLALLEGDGRTGDTCASELDCHSGVCAVSGEPPSGHCADLCCSPSDCGGGTTCGFVAGLGGAVVRACVDAPTGAEPDGAFCADDGESCQGGQCLESKCRSVCCTDADCVPPRRCLPRTSSEGVLVPVCADPDTE